MANGNTPPGPAFFSAPAPQPVVPTTGLSPQALAVQAQLEASSIALAAVERGVRFVFAGSG
jgi:hypothetical protein